MTALFPCRLDKHERTVRVVGCRRCGCSCTPATPAARPFSLAVVDGGEPARVEPLLAALKASVAANLGGGARARRAVRAAGRDAEPGAARCSMCSGRLPDGRPVTAHAAFFVHGVRVLSGDGRRRERSPEDAVRSFFGAIKLTS